MDFPCSLDDSRESVKCQVVGGIARAPVWEQTHSYTKSSSKSQRLLNNNNNCRKEKDMIIDTIVG